MKKLKTWVLVVGGLLLSGGLVFAGYSLAQPTISDLAERNRELAASDSLKQVRLDEQRITSQRAVFDFTSTNDLLRFANDSLSEQNAALIRSNQQKDRQIETLVSTNASLRDTLSSVLSDITIDDTSVSAHISARNDYEDGFVGAEGDVNIDTSISPPEGRATLDFEVGMSPTVSIARDTTGLATCDITFGDMPIEVLGLQCLNNIDPDLPARRSFWEFAPEITLGSLVLLGVGAGAAILVF